MQFILFFLADQAFHWVLGLGYIILYLLMARIVRGLDQRRHLKWLIPYLIGAVIDLLSRSIYNIHFVLRTRWGPQALMISSLIDDATTLIGAYGTIVLYSILVQWFKESSGTVQQTGIVEEANAAFQPPAQKTRQD